MVRAGTTRRLLSLLAGAAVLLVTAGCANHSRVDPNADVTVIGTALSVDGHALAHRPIRLGAGVSPGDATFAVLTAGLACTTGVCQGKVRDTVTDAAGRYTFHLKGRDTQSTFGEAESELLSVTAAPVGRQATGATATARLRIQSTRLVVPTLRLVDPHLELTATEGHVVATWSIDRPGPYTLSFRGSQTTPVWQSAVTGPTTRLDARLLEDTAGRTDLSGTSTDQAAGTDVQLTWRSPAIAYAAGAGPPPSRGRACTFMTATGTDAPAHGRCGLTDGDLATVTAAPTVCAPIADSGCRQATQAVITLGRPLPVTLVVVRGCHGGCAVDTSVDGRTFTPTGAVSEDFGTVAMPGRVISAVRVGLGASGLREVSVWGARGGQGLRPLSPDERPNFPGVFSAGTPGGTVPVTVAVLAGVLVAACAIGIAYVLGRRAAGR